MKSKKIVALIVAFVAFMAVATSGLAAVTTTTYLGDKVTVSTTIAAETGKEVTYLVKSNNQIIYIDQQTAEDGEVTFNYKIAKGKLVDYASTVQFGTNGTAITDTENTALLFDGVNVTSDAGVETVTFHTTAACNEAAVEFEKIGNGDKVWAKITLKDNYELATVTLDGENVKNDAPIIEVAMGQTLAIKTTEKNVTPEIKVEETVVQGGTETIVPDDKNKEFVEDTTRYVVKDFTLKVIGNPVNAGVMVNGEFAKAEYAPNETSYDPGKVYAVRIIDVFGNEVSGTPTYNYGINN